MRDVRGAAEPGATELNLTMTTETPNHDLEQYKTEYIPEVLTILLGWVVAGVIFTAAITWPAGWETVVMVSGLWLLVAPPIAYGIYRYLYGGPPVSKLTVLKI